jgi:predicted amidohydrolase
MAKWNGSYTWDKPPSATDAPARLTVATCQMAVTHDIQRNTAAIVELIREAKAAGADVAHFPECALSGYGPETWPDWTGFGWDMLASATQTVRAAARANGIWVVVGTVHRSTDGAWPTNSLLVIDRHGEIAGRYDKQRCSVNDLNAFAPGTAPLVIEIDSTACGFLICLDWAFPEVWQAYAGKVELVFHACVSDNIGRDRNPAHTIPPLIQGYAFLYQYAISVANSCRPLQDFASFWIERSGHKGETCERSVAGLVINGLKDDPEQDRFFAMVRTFRDAASDGSLYAASRARRRGPAS